MHEKRKLDLTELRVESFDTSPARAAARGTVHAHSGYDYCDSFGCESLICGSNQPDTCYAGCGNNCADTHTSEYGWVSCDHSQCGPYTCDPYESCHMGSQPVAC